MKKIFKVLIPVFFLFFVVPSISFAEFSVVTASDITASSVTLNATGLVPNKSYVFTVVTYDVNPHIKFSKLVIGNNDGIARDSFSISPSHKYEAIIYAVNSQDVLEAISSWIYFDSPPLNLSQNIKSPSFYILNIKIIGDNPAGSSVQTSEKETNIIYENCPANTNNETNCFLKTIAVGKNMELTALPSQDAIFYAWGGDCAGSIGVKCNLKMNSEKNVSVIFNKANIITGGNNNQNQSNSNNVVNNTSNNNSTSNSGGSIQSSNGGLVPCFTPGNKQGDCNWNTLMTLINNIVNFVLFRMAIPIAAIMFAYAGILLLTSGGDSAKKTKAKELFTGVAIGLIIAAAAWLIVNTILSILGYTNTGTWFNL